MNATLTSWANGIWAWYSARKGWVKVLIWLVFYWGLIPVLVWKSPKAASPLKWASTVAGAVLLLFALALSSTPPATEAASGSGSIVSGTDSVGGGTPATPRAALEAAIRDEFEGTSNTTDLSKYRSLTFQPDGSSFNVVFEFNADENFTNNLTRKGIELDMAAFYRLVFTSDVPVKSATASAYFPLVDKYGNESQGEIYSTRMKATVGSQVNWDNSDYLDFSQLWDVLFILPDLYS